MPLRSPLLWFVCCLLGGQTGLAQDRLMLADGSEEIVELRRLSDVRQASEVAFRSDGELSVRRPEAVTGFRFVGPNLAYRRVSVELPDARDPDRRTEKYRFAEVLATGAFELYKVYLDQHEYAVGAAGAEPYQYILIVDGHRFDLKLSTIRVYERWHANPARFRNILKFLTQSCPEANKLAAEARFADSDILKVLDHLADCRGADDFRLDERRLKGGLSIEHYPRVMYIDMRDGSFSNNQISAGVGYEAVTRFLNRFERLSVLTSLSLIYHSFTWQEMSNVQQAMVRGNLSLGYTPVIDGDLRVQLTGGLSNYNALASSFNSFLSNNYFMLNGGINVRKANFVIGLHYEVLPGQIDRRPANQLLTSVGYRLSF